MRNWQAARDLSSARPASPADPRHVGCPGTAEAAPEPAQQAGDGRPRDQAEVGMHLFASVHIPGRSGSYADWELCRNIQKTGFRSGGFRSPNRPPAGRRQANVRSSAIDVPRTKERPGRHQPQSSDAPRPIPRRLFLPLTFRRRPLSRVTGRVLQGPPAWTLLKGSVA
jgi:hypothetical protein